jgi:hypothetical protein
MNSIDFTELSPCRFNPWKHHLRWVCRQLDELHKTNDAGLWDEVLSYMKTINSNHADVYTGNLSPYEIVQNVVRELDTLKITDKLHFIEWLGKMNFRLIRLTDSSVWVIREGKGDERYIHFHPARNSPHAVRIHGNSWKTAIALKLMDPSRSDFSLSEINKVRKNYLNLSPIKDTDGSVRLQAAFELLARGQ